MSAQTALANSISSADHAALKSAVKYLETRNFAGRLADYAGVPIHRVLGFLPRALNRQLSGAVRHAVMKGLEVAVDTLDEKPPRKPSTGFSSFLAGVTGGVSGLFGFGALAVELPLTTTLMLRAIAEIAQHQGEDLSTLEARLACLEVFAYGAKRNEDNLDVGYYAARALISKYTHDIAALALERGAIDASAPVVASLVSEIVSRFGLRLADHRRGRWRHGQYRLHGPLPAGRARAFHGAAARARLWQRACPGALCGISSNKAQCGLLISRLRKRSPGSPPAP
jgi:EcsC protein family